MSDFDESSGRYTVELDDSEMLRIKHENLFQQVTMQGPVGSSPVYLQ